MNFGFLNKSTVISRVTGWVIKESTVNHFLRVGKKLIKVPFGEGKPEGEKQCEGIKKNGERCTRKVKPGQKYCQQHQDHYSGIIKKISKRIAGMVIAFIGLLSSLVGLGLIQPFIPLTRMNGEFNVAVANFSNSDGTKSQIGKEIAAVFSRHLDAELDSYTTSNQIIRVIDILPPEKTGTINGKNAKDRAKKAQNLAVKVNAQIIIYGTVEKINNDLIISPSFSVSPKYIQDAYELIGQYRMGAPIIIKNPDDNLASQLNFNNELSDRSSALASITLGLYNYFAEQYEEALQFYKDADAFQAWYPNDGKEVLYVLMGNAAVKDDHFEEAIYYYDRALSLNNEYARGYIGLGTASFREALEDTSEVDYEKVSRAISFFERALSAKDQPDSSLIDFKVYFGLGEGKLLLSQAGKADLLESARSDFSYIIEYYKKNPNELLRDRTSQAYAHLGLISYIQGARMIEVQNYYNQASDLAAGYDGDLAARYLEELANLYIKEKDMNNAKSALSKAAEVVIQPNEKNKINEQLESLNNPILISTP